MGIVRLGTFTDSVVFVFLFSALELALPPPLTVGVVGSVRTKVAVISCFTYIATVFVVLLLRFWFVSHVSPFCRLPIVTVTIGLEVPKFQSTMSIVLFLNSCGQSLQ